MEHGAETGWAQASEFSWSTRGGQTGCNMEQRRARQGIALTSYVNLRTLGMDTQLVGVIV